MILLALAAELADLATFHPWNEANPIVNFLGPWSVSVKLLVVLVVVAGTVAVRKRWKPVLVTAIVAGSVGTLSNVA